MAFIQIGLSGRIQNEKFNSFGLKEFNLELDRIQFWIK